MARPKREKNTVTGVFSERLKRLTKMKMDELGQTQAAIADNIGIPPSSLSEFQSDMKTPGIDTLYKIAKYFDVSADYLLGLTEVETPDIDKRAICAKTHLSEKAVEELTDPLTWVSEEGAVQALINALLESPHLFRLGYEYNRFLIMRGLYAKSDERHAELMSMVSISAEDRDFLSNPAIMKQVDRDNVDYAAFQLNKVWLQFLNDLTDVHETR